jgi:hypothetical protein
MVKRLTDCCQHFREINGDWPQSLDALAAPQPKGGAAFVFPDDLIGPWGHPFQYDPAGPKNHGEQPDIWTVTPQGKVIGNWPGGH